MGSNLSIKIKAKGKHAKKLMQAVSALPDTSGANYVSRNDLHLDPGTSSGKTRASERVPYKPRPGIAGESSPTSELKATSTAQANIPESGSKVALNPEGFGPSHVGEGIHQVTMVTREINPVEKARMHNNKCRDMRTNLGRGKAGIPSVEEENNVSVTR